MKCVQEGWYFALKHHLVGVISLFYMHVCTEGERCARGIFQIVTPAVPEIIPTHTSLMILTDSPSKSQDYLMKTFAYLMTLALLPTGFISCLQFYLLLGYGKHARYT